MRIGIITERYPPNVKGGGEISVHLLARGLRDRGARVEVLSFDGESEDIHEGIRVKRVRSPRSLHFPIEKSNLLAYPTIKAFSEEKDILHGYNMKYYPAIARVSKVLGLPSVLTMTTYGFYYPHHVEGLRDPETLLGRVHQRLADKMARSIINDGADAMILLSRAEMEIYIEAGFAQEKMRVIPNFADPRFRLESTDRIPPATRAILYSGRLSPEKGVETLIRAFATVSVHHPELKLVIVGTGPLTEELERLAGSLGVGRSVEFVGRIPYDRMRDIYRDAYVFVHPGIWAEPFGRSILEAMASGVPVIASNTGSAPDILDDSGLLFEPKDADGLASQLETVIRDTDLWLQLSRDARKRVDQRFSAERVTGSILALYKEVSLASGPSPASGAGRVVRGSKEGWVERARHRFGRLLDVTAVPAVRKVSSFYFALLRRPDGPTKSNPKRILFALFTRGIGDAILCTPALNAVKRKHPGCNISVLAAPYLEELVEHFKDVDQFIPFPIESARLSDVYRIVRRLRGLRFDTAVDILADRSVLSALICFLSGAKNLIGFASGFRAVFLNRGCPAEREGIHFADSLKNMLVREGLARDEAVPLESALASEEEKTIAAAALVGSTRPVFCVHPGSRGAKEFRWAPDRWVALLELIRRKHRSTILIIGSKNEEGLCRYIEEGLNGGSTNLAGRCTVGQTAALIERSDVLLSIASGPLHMAVAMGIPAVYVGGGVDLVRWGAYGNSVLHRAVLRSDSCKPEDCRSCPHRTGSCSSGITVAAFFQAVEDTLEKINS